MSIGLTVSILLMLEVTGGAVEPYRPANRSEYIKGALEAFASTNYATVRDVYSYVSAVERNQCRSFDDSFKVRCLMKAVDKNCRAKRSRAQRALCHKYSDIVVVNKLSETVFVSKRERYHMMKHARDYRAAMLNALQQKYVTVATEFALWGGAKCSSDEPSCLARGIDKFCLNYSDHKHLSWQYCVGSLVWFIGLHSFSGDN